MTTITVPTPEPEPLDPQEVRIASLKATLEEVRAELASCATRRDYLQERVNFLQSRVARLTEDRDDLRVERNVLVAKLDRIREVLDEI